MKKMFWILLIVCLGAVLETDAQEYMFRRRWLEEGIIALGETTLVQQTNETQEIDGVSFEIIQAYADRRIMIFWYVISGLELPEGQIYGRYLTASLSNADGSWHPNSGAYYIDPQREDGVIYGIFEFGHASEYPADGIYKHQLQITIGGVWQNFYLLPGDFVVDENPIPDEYQYEIPEYGTYIFDLNLNVFPDRIIEIGETVESNGISMSLERIHLLPFLVTIDLCYQIPNDDDWMADPLVLIDSRDEMLSNGGEDRADKPGLRCTGFRFLDTLSPNAESLRVEVPRLITSIPEIISPELAARAEAELAELGIIVDYRDDGTLNYEVIFIPEEYEDRAGWLIYDALRERYEGEWNFEIELPESLFGE